MIGKFRNDLAFDAFGYFYLILNNLFTAANGIYIKKNLDHDLVRFSWLSLVVMWSLADGIRCLKDIERE